jgi:succinate-semialdehyde dehydrogenase/glutarate-semialdehyde dehydrogenase
VSLAATVDRGFPPLAMVIDGERIGVGQRRTHRLVNPATGETLGELPLADAADLDRALEAAGRGFERWRRTPAEARGAVLKGAAELLRQRADEIARIATLEEGKTFVEARIEVGMAAGLFEFYGEEARRTYGRVLVRPTGQRSLVIKQPVGPVAAFAPWNFPIGNPARKLGAPIAAGCSVILKPAEESPASALAVLQALLDAGLPADVAQVVFGVPDEVSRHLLASPVIAKLSFTGSTTVGKQLMKLAADRCIRTTMELGGHAPVLVFDDADLDQALDLLVTSKARNAGQVCVSPTRFYVQEGVYERFARAFADRFAALPVGDGLDATVRMGPMANPRRPTAVAAMVADAVAHGARVMTGGEPLDGPGWFWRPTVLADVPTPARVMNEEPFGPLALMAPFRDFDEAIVQANRLPFGLAAYAFTRDAKRVMLLGDAIESGMVAINTTMIGAADAPFGGIKESGHGAEDGPEGLEACLVTKAIHQG